MFSYLTGANCPLFLFSRGHNELDDPSMTQPSMYKAIDTRSSVPDTYWDQLQVCCHMTVT